MTFQYSFLSSIIAYALFLNTTNTFAETCPSSSFDLATLQIDIPCVFYQDTPYSCLMDAVQAVSETELVWKLDGASLKASTCTTEMASCAITSNELGLTLKKLDIDGVAHTAKLAYTQDPANPSELYWKYITHYPESTTKAINLRVSYYDTYANTLSKKAQIEANLRHFSEAIYESSNGAHRLGKVTVFTDGAHADNTDILWLKDTNAHGRPCWFNSHIGGRGKKGQRIQHCDIGTNHRGSYNMLEKPRSGGYTMGHEWGHFFYGLYDEYQGQSFCDSSRPHIPCSSDTPADMSIMNKHWNALNTTNDSLADLRWLNFSTIQSRSINNAHYRMYESNGWETLIRAQNQDPQQSGRNRPYYPELLAVAPDSGQTPSLELETSEGFAAATENLQIIFKPGNSQRTTRKTRADENTFGWIGTVRQIVIEHSSVVTRQQLHDVKAAVQSLINESEIGDVIGIIAFDARLTVIQPLTLIDTETTREALILAIENITPGTGKAMIGKTLSEVLSGLFSSKTHKDLVYSIYLFTNGIQALEESALIEKAAAELDKNDVMLFILATTEDTRAIKRLMSAAEQASGEFFLTTNQHQLQHALEEMHVLSSPILDVTVTQRYLTFNKDVDVPFYLDDSLAKVEINIAFYGSLENMQMTLFDPKGTTYPFKQEHCKILYQPEAGQIQYTFCTMESKNFAVGQWTLQGKPTKATQNELFFSVSAIPKHKAASFFASIWTLEEEPVQVQQPIIVQATVSAHMPITGLQITPILETSDEQHLPFPMLDDGTYPDMIANDGLYTGVITPTKAGNYHIFVDFNNSANKAHYSDFGIAYAPDHEGNVPEQQLYPIGMPFQRFAMTQIWVIE